MVVIVIFCLFLLFGLLCGRVVMFWVGFVIFVIYMFEIVGVFGICIIFVVRIVCVFVVVFFLRDIVLGFI